MGTEKAKHLDIINLLRGIAALMVCFCHIGGAINDNHSNNEILNSFGILGQFGVRMFFIISGFVIPLSLDRGKYTIANYSRFLYKRLLRLHIPYIFALALTLVLTLFSDKIRHAVFHESIVDIFKMLFYLKAPNDNLVFWTLGIEVQYYFFIGLYFILIYKYPRYTIVLTIPLLFIVFYFTEISDFITLISYLVFFLIGIVGYLIYVKRGLAILNFLALIILITSTILFQDIAAFVASMLTIIAILYVKIPVSNFFKFFGSISYSIYLLHIPIGVKFINLFKKYFSSSYDYLLFLLALALIISVSWIFYNYIEKPAERLSSNIKYQ